MKRLAIQLAFILTVINASISIEHSHIVSAVICVSQALFFLWALDGGMPWLARPAKPDRAVPKGLA
jgi:hypothetical protein